MNKVFYKWLIEKSLIDCGDFRIDFAKLYLTAENLKFTCPAKGFEDTYKVEFCYSYPLIENEMFPLSITHIDKGYFHYYNIHTQSLYASRSFYRDFPIAKAALHEFHRRISKDELLHSLLIAGTKYYEEEQFKLYEKAEKLEENKQKLFLYL